MLLTFLLVLPAKAPEETDINQVASSTASKVGIDDMLIVNSPAPDALIKSPLAVTGKARGTWFFEASAPVKILDADGNELGIVPAQAEGNWMTTDFVNFSASLDFKTPATATGILVFMKDNPSGLPQYDMKFEMPVRFK